MIPQLKSPPRVRVEWLIAGARVVLAFGTLLAMAINPGELVRPTAYFLGWYSIYSLTLLALVWTPVRFARGWDIIVHVVDVAAFAAWFFLVDGVTDPMVVYYLFVLICATIRWQSVGTMWTAGVAVSLQAAIGLYVSTWLGAPAAKPLDVATRSVYMLLIAALVAYLGTHQDRFQYEISRLASWPRKPTKDPRELVSEIIRQSSEFLRAPRTVLVWEEPGEGWVNVAWQGEYDVMWTQEPEAKYGSFVLPGLERSSFQAADAAIDSRVMLLRSTGFRRRQCRPVNEALRARFNMSAVQSWPLNGELLRGRMFCLDQVRMRLDDLILGEVVAWLAVTRLESHYWQERLRDAAALDERVRLARDLHDSLLQSQTGVALQLVAARRLLERDELELRTFVSRLRPAVRPVAPAALSLAERLDELRQRVERQWEIHVRLQLDAIDGLPDELLEGTYRLAQESVVNAARHADASVIDVRVTRADGRLELRIADDGRGFPFQGTYDLAALNGMNEGPLTLKERVADLGGALTLVSAESGTELLITLPLTRVPM